MSDTRYWCEELRKAAAFLREGSHASADSVLSQVQQHPSPLIVEIAQALLSEMDEVEAACRGKPAAEVTAILSPVVHNQYVSARIVRGAFVRDWKVYWVDHFNEALGMVDRYLSQHSDLLCYAVCTPVLSELCSIWAIVGKLKWNSDREDSQCATMQSISSRLLQALQAPSDRGDGSSFVGWVLARHVVEEFGMFDPRFRCRGMPLASHEASRKSFEEQALLPLWSATLQFLFDATHQQEEPSEALVYQSLQCFLATMSWRFSSLNVSVFESSDLTPDRLNIGSEEWRSALLTSSPDGSGPIVQSVLAKLFRMYVGNQEKQQLVVNILVQVCSVTGNLWQVEQRVAHADNCFRVAFEFLTCILGDNASEEMDEERGCILLSAVNSIRRLVDTIGTESALFEHPDLGNAFIAPLLSLTQVVIEKTHAFPEQETLTEALDHLLQTWLTLVRSGLGDPTVRAAIERTPLAEALAGSSASVLRCFVTCKVTASSMRSQQSAAAECPETTHVEEYARSHTQLLALLGREQPAIVALFLSDTLRCLTEQYLALLARRQTISFELNEALWYVLTIAGHFLADTDESEKPTIPLAIIELAQQHEQQYEEDLLQQENANEVLCLMRGIVGFSHEVGENLRTMLVSPGVCQALLFCLARYSGCYLFADESSHSEFSRVFSSCFNGGVAAAEAALMLASASLTNFPNDSDVHSSVFQLFQSLGKKPRAFGEWIVQQEVYRYLCKLALGAAGSMRLDGASQGKVLCFLISVVPPEAVVNIVLNDTLTILQRQLQTAADGIVAIPTIEALGGVFEALRSPALVESAFPSLEPMLQLVMHFAETHRVPPLSVALLRLLNVIVTGCGVFLSAAALKEVVECCVSAVQLALPSPSSSIVVSNELAKEEAEERIVALAECTSLILNVASWGLIDFNFSEDASHGDVVGDLSVAGLLSILRCCDDVLLRTPEIRDGVFKLLKETAQTHTKQFVSVPPEDANLLLEATHQAIVSDVAEATRCGYQVMESIAGFSRRNNIQFDLLPSFLKCVLQNCCDGALDAAVIPSASNALFALTQTCGLASTLSILEQCQANPTSIQFMHELLLSFENCFCVDSVRRNVRFLFCNDFESVIVRIKSMKLW